MEIIELINDKPFILKVRTENNIYPIVWFLLHKFKLILNCEKNNPSIKNDYGHISVAQKSGLQSCHRHKNNTKSKSSLFTYLFGILYFDYKTLVWFWLYKFKLILNYKENNPSIKNGYDHISAAQNSGLQNYHRCHRHKNNTKSNAFIYLFGISAYFLCILIKN